MSKPRGWRAYYADRTIDSTEARPAELPDGLLGVVEFLEPPRRELVYGGDWYWIEDGRWQTGDTVWNGWVERPHNDAIRGQGVPDTIWNHFERRMMEDREWP